MFTIEHQVTTCVFFEGCGSFDSIHESRSMVHRSNYNSYYLKYYVIYNSYTCGMHKKLKYAFIHHHLCYYFEE